MLMLLFVAALWAGAQNALAGGGTFILLPTLMASGLDPRLANISATIALFPGQVMTGWVGRDQMSAAAGVRLGTIALISLAGGALGAVLLLNTSEQFFARLVPWLVLFATSVFAYGSFRKRPASQGHAGPVAVIGMQFVIATYGGYFGGGVGFLMLALLTAAGLAVRQAGATKNVLNALINASAVLIFLFTPDIPWLRVATVAVGALAGGYVGAHALRRLNETVVRVFIVLIGACLTVGLFIRAR